MSDACEYRLVDFEEFRALASGLPQPPLRDRAAAQATIGEKVAECVREYSAPAPAVTA